MTNADGVNDHELRLTRRDLITGALAVASSPIHALPAAAEADDLSKTISQITHGADARIGKVTLTLPELAENGNVVSLLVNVDSPMTETEHVKTIHILSEKNPIVTVAKFHLGSRAGRARVATNIRLATSQRVVGLAEMNDGSFWLGEQSVIVTLAACIDGG